MADQDKQDFKVLEREIRVLKKKLKRSEQNRFLYEEAQERSQAVQKSLIDDLEVKTAALKESEEKAKERVEKLNNSQKAMLNILEDLNIQRTKAEEFNKKISDSIQYASLIQSALIPEDDLFKLYFEDHYSIWQPKDIVGGDIYLFEELRDQSECLLMIIDCTGHGVPGAFVTMLVKAIERQIVSKIENDPEIDVSPAWILGYFNKKIKKMLQQESDDSISNAGFDGGVIHYSKKTNTLKFAGAETPLFYFDDAKLKVIKGSRQSIGYKKSNTDFEFQEHTIPIKERMHFYLTTDGYLDQNGGEKSYPMGKKRFSSILNQSFEQPFENQKNTLLDALQVYQASEERNDDITVVGFELKEHITNRIILEYSGALTQGIIVHSIEMIENKIDNINLQGKVSTLVIELTQNMMHYSKSQDPDSKEIVPAGLIEVLEDNKSVYYVKSENIVSIEDKNKIKATLTEMQSLNEQEMKKRYRELRKSGVHTHEKGGGIGFYEIAKLTQAFKYSFTEINSQKYRFKLQARISSRRKSKEVTERKLKKQEKIL